MKEIKCQYEPCIRACVIVTYTPPIIHNIELKDVSISIFEKGNIIITGARSRDQIISSYDYINSLLVNFKTDIIRNNNIDEDKIREDIMKEVMDNIEQYIN